MFETMELRDTVDMMLSDDYKERFKAEYYQAIIRWEKLKRILTQLGKGEANFTLDSPTELLRAQLKGMGDYIAALQARASAEKIDIGEAPQEFLWWFYMQ